MPFGVLVTSPKLKLTESAMPSPLRSPGAAVAPPRPGPDSEVPMRVTLAVMNSKRPWLISAAGTEPGSRSRTVRSVLIASGRVTVSR